MSGEYALKEDLIARFGETEILQLTDRAMEGVIDDTLVTTILAEAQSEVNSYIGAIYDLPLTMVQIPTVLVTAVCNIARYRLYNQAATEEVKIRYDDTIRWLRDIARGVATLGIPVDDAPVSNSVVVSSRSQVFSESCFDLMGPSWP